MKDPVDLRTILEEKEETQLASHQQAIAAAPAFAAGGIFGKTHDLAASSNITELEDPIDPTSVFVVHGRDLPAKDAPSEGKGCSHSEHPSSAYC